MTTSLGLCLPGLSRRLSFSQTRRHQHCFGGPIGAPFKAPNVKIAGQAFIASAWRVKAATAADAPMDNPGDSKADITGYKSNTKPFTFGDAISNANMITLAAFSSFVYSIFAAILYMFIRFDTSVFLSILTAGSIVISLITVLCKIYLDQEQKLQNGKIEEQKKRTDALEKGFDRLIVTQGSLYIAFLVLVLVILEKIN